MQNFFRKVEGKVFSNFYGNMVLDIRDFQSKMYKFLEHPSSFWSLVYHIGIFAYILILHSLCVFAELPVYKWLLTNVQTLDFGLAIIFILEFFIRLWSVGADARFMGWRGRFRYLSRFICIVDVIILLASIFIVSERENSTNDTLAKLHFLQILRLFHIDRQMTTWRLIKEIIQKSSKELITAYYLTFVVFLFLGTFVYTVETFFDEEIDGIFQNSTETSPTFKNYGESLWFSIISILTVGYGDMVPKRWLSKFVTTWMSYIGICLFCTASNLVGFIMSMKIKEDKRRENKNLWKKRDTAAKFIQNWYRLRLIMNKKIVGEIEFFKFQCARIQTIDETWKKSKNFQNHKKFRVEEFFKRRTSFSPLGDRYRKKTSSHTSLAFTNNLARRNGILNKLPYDLEGQITVRCLPTMNNYRKLTLPATRSFNTLDDYENNLLDSHDTLLTQETNTSTYFSNEDFQANSLFGSEQELNKLNEEKVNKYLYILQMVYYIRVVWLKKKFHLLRIPHDELIDVEEALCEMEYQNRKKLNELEFRLDATIGKPVPSPLNPYGIEKCSIQKRLELCEEKVKNVDQKFSEVLKVLELLEATLTGSDSMKNVVGQKSEVQRERSATMPMEFL